MIEETDKKLSVTQVKSLRVSAFDSKWGTLTIHKGLLLFTIDANQDVEGFSIISSPTPVQPLPAPLSAGRIRRLQPVPHRPLRRRPPPFSPTLHRRGRVHGVVSRSARLLPGFSPMTMKKKPSTGLYPAAGLFAETCRTFRKKSLRFLQVQAQLHRTMV